MVKNSRRRLYEDLQMHLSGHSVEDCIGATADSLASSIGFAANSLEHADRLIDAMVDDLKRTVRENWEYLRSVRNSAAANSVGSA